ncbi:MAG: protein kinase [Chloroflexaceae bacterium]|nr:protein kinase [Chloroflexaceae bacterium]
MLICLDQRSHSGCQAHNPDNATRCQQCGRDLRFALKLQDPGTVIGNYRIEQVIGHGGFGAVYEATQRTSTGSKVALKENFESDMIQRFQREFQVLRALKHDNLPRYDAMFEQDGNAYLVMELVVGQNLEEILQRNQHRLWWRRSWPIRCSCAMC